MHLTVHFATHFSLITIKSFLMLCFVCVFFSSDVYCRKHHVWLVQIVDHRHICHHHNSSSREIPIIHQQPLHCWLFYRMNRNMNRNSNSKQWKQWTACSKSTWPKSQSKSKSKFNQRRPNVTARSGGSGTATDTKNKKHSQWQNDEGKKHFCSQCIDFWPLKKKL